MTEALRERLSLRTTNGKARAAALEAVLRLDAHPTSLVAYQSSGYLLILGQEDLARELAVQQKAMQRIVIVTNMMNSAPFHETEGITVLRGTIASLKGHLGQFEAILSTPAGSVNIAHLAALKRDHFDLVLDLNTPPLLPAELPPFGYYPVGDDRKAQARALAELPEMVGEFEKPKFFHYNPDICAHGVSGITGCTRCLEVCPTLAIRSLGDKIAVDPYLCQGAASCVVACPTGAISYAYPSAANTLERLRTLLGAYRSAGGSYALLLFHDAERGQETVERIAACLSERIIPIEVAEIGSVGMEVWLGALAYGANQVALLHTPTTPSSVLSEIKAQLSFASAILDGMGYAPDRLQLLDGANGHLKDTLAELQPAPEIPAAGFAGFDEKRTNIWMAVDHLYRCAPATREQVSLPEGAPFGQVLVDRDACTLCMGCVSVCPTGALVSGEDVPRLSFYEERCVQCGLCESACPENAITCVPRFIYDAEVRRAVRVLNEEAPFHCILCGKPFATRSMIDRMAEKLKGHWMFQDEQALRRLKMCGDCRVRDNFQSERRAHSH
jgi:Formate hydrogenlyase subunit 6/NADH:ubiquinone oxidoreductase 23 kD subunit (chain I)